MSIDNKELEANVLDDDVLEEVSGGKKIASKLPNAKKGNKKVSNTLYSGEPTSTSNLLYKENDEKFKTIDLGSRLC